MQDRAERNNSFPQVSVLLPAWNEETTLGRCIDSLLAIDSPGLELIICAGGADATTEIARRFQHDYPGKVTVLEQCAGEGKQSALRRAYQLSRGDVIYLTDADCVVPAETLRTLVEAVGPGGADAATGPAEPLPEQQSSAWVRHQWATIRAVDRRRSQDSTGLLGRNCAVRRDAIEAAGAFQDNVKIGTDYHLAKMLRAAGRSIHYLPVAVETQFGDDFLSYSSQQSRWMRNILIHGPRFGDRAEIKGVVRSIALGISLLVWPFTWPWTKVRGIALWLIPICWMIRVRIRNQALLDEELNITPATANVPRAALFSLADLVVWARPAFDLIIARRRHRW